MHYGIILEINKQCNMDCPECYLSTFNRLNNKKILNSEHVKKFFSHPLFKGNSMNVIFEGGEIGIGNHAFNSIYEISDFFKKEYDVKNFALLTNFLVINPQVFEYIRKYNCQTVETTFDFDRQDWSHSRDNFKEKFKENIETTLELFPNISLVFNVIINKFTYDLGIEAFYEYFSKIKTGPHNKIILQFEIGLNFKRYFLEPKNDVHGFPFIPTDITYQDYSNYLKSLSQFSEPLLKNNVVLDYVGSINKSGEMEMFKLHNHQQRDTIFVNNNGEITMNPFYSDMPSAMIGNINTMDFGQYLQHPKYKYFMRKFFMDNKLQCKKMACEFFDVCGGGLDYLSLFDTAVEKTDRNLIAEECSGLYNLRKSLYNKNNTKTNQLFKTN